jgi:hypothetical protein
MAIKPIMLQRRMAEVGRIRIGETKVSKNGKTYPAKLDRLRFTSASKPLLDQVAAAYGGQVREWTPANGGPAQWEVITDADRVPVIVPPASVSQYMESWSGGGCQRRCDGETELLSGTDCICTRTEKMECKPTTRLSVMLREIPGVGVWRLESHGWNAAAELPDTAEFLARAGGYIPASLYLKPQRTIVEVNGKPQTADFVVPALEVEGVTPAQLLAGGSGPAAIRGGGRAALESGDRRDIVALIGAAQSRDEVVELWEEAKKTGAVNAPQIEAAAKARVAQLLAAADQDAAEQASTPEPSPPPGRDPETIWNEIVNSASDDQTISDLEQEFAKRNQGVLPESATAEQLEAFLWDLQNGWGQR